MLDSSCLYGSCTKPVLAVVSLGEGHKERMESGGLDKHLRLRLVMDCRI